MVEEGRQHTFKIGPILIRVVVTGAETVELIGSYQHVAETSEPDAILRAHLSTGFRGGGPKTSNYPEFNSSMDSEDTLSVERSDAKGSIFLGDSEQVRADFVGEASSSSLEAMIRVVASLALPAKGSLILHSSAIESGGKAHVFSGVSGAGKSTIVDMLGAHYAIDILSDELLLVSRREDCWHLDVAPFSGKIDLPHGKSSPLGSLNLLEQAPRHERQQISPHEAMSELPRHIIGYVKHPKTLSQVLNLAGDLVEAVPCYRLRFAKKPDVGDLFDLACS